MAHLSRPTVRRALQVVIVLILVAVIVGILVVRQVVFGGTPALHQQGNRIDNQACSSTPLPTGFEAFALNAQQSSVSYTAHFQAAGQPLPGTVTGETNDVRGEFLLSTTPTPTLRSLKFTIDLRTLGSGSADRDEHIRNDTFETTKFPLALFTVQQADIFSGNYREGAIVNFALEGQLTLHGVTHAVTFAMQGKRQGDTVTGSGSTVIQLQDFAMKDPELTSVVPITIGKAITLMIQLTAQKETCQHSASFIGSPV